jgi:hypothetical protein
MGDASGALCYAVCRGLHCSSGARRLSRDAEQDMAGVATPSRGGTGTAVWAAVGHCMAGLLLGVWVWCVCQQPNGVTYPSGGAPCRTGGEGGGGGGGG